MAVDPRITRAKKVLRDALADGDKHEAAAPNRATGTRARYKHGWQGALAALEVLEAKPKK